jgi:3-methyladenine DNA glycosylase AlkD
MHQGNLVQRVRDELRRLSDPERATGMQAYLKSDMPALGVRVPEVRRAVREAAKDFPPPSVEDLCMDVLTLWREAGYREERYAAIELTGLRLAKTDLAMLPVYEEIIRTGAWWDLVDGVSHRICGLLQANRDALTATLLAWSTDPDLWIRRAAITSQLGAKSTTDTVLLGAVIVPNLADTEFFIRKAIGWALRDYSATDPEWVRNFVREYSGAMSGLSRREALRNLPAR